MEKLTSQKELEFEMIYHIKTGKFEKVKILNYESKAELAVADFSTQAVPKPQTQAPVGRKQSPPARSSPLSTTKTAQANNRARSTNTTAIKRPTAGAASRPAIINKSAIKKPV